MRIRLSQKIGVLDLTNQTQLKKPKMSIKYEQKLFATCQVPRGAQENTPPPTDCPNKGEWNIRVPMEGRPKAAGTGHE